MEPRDPWLATRTRSTRRFADAFTAVRRLLLRRRRLLAALLIGVAVAAAMGALAPPAPSTTTLVVAARDLPAGHVLASEDLVETSVPPDLVPQGAGRIQDRRGRVLAAPVRAGEALTDVRLLGPDLVSAGDDGDTVATPVRLSDAGQAALLTVGDPIDLLATDPRAGETVVLARRAMVLALPDANLAADGALPGRLIVLGVSRRDVQEVTAASVASYVTYAWDRR